MDMSDDEMPSDGGTSPKPEHTEMFNEDELLESQCDSGEEESLAAVGQGVLPGERGVCLSRTKAPSTIDDETIKVDIDDLMEIQAERLEAATRHLDEEKQKVFKELREKALIAFQSYDIEGPPSRAEINSLRELIITQQAAIVIIIEDHQSSKKKLEEALETFKEELEIRSKKESLLHEKMEVLSKENFLKRDSNAPACYVCSSPKHKAECCLQFPDANSRRLELIRDGKCLYCYDMDHSSEDCPKYNMLPTCRRCKPEKHERFLCSKRATKERTEAYNARGSRGAGLEPQQKEKDGSSEGEPMDPEQEEDI